MPGVMEQGLQQRHLWGVGGRELCAETLRLCLQTVQPHRKASCGEASATTLLLERGGLWGEGSHCWGPFQTPAGT